MNLKPTLLTFFQVLVFAILVGILIGGLLYRVMQNLLVGLP